MADRDFSELDGGEFGGGNQALWKGLMGNTAYPSKRDGADLRTNRDALLSRWKAKYASTCDVRAPNIKDFDK